MNSLLASKQLLPPESTALLGPKCSPAASIAVVAMEFDDANLKAPNGFGHLLPLSEDDTILGVVYDSCVFPHMDGRAKGRKTTRFTVMMAPHPEWLSRPSQPDPFDLDPVLRDQLIELGVAALNRQLGLNVAKPCHAYTGVWNNCIPSYPVGHPENVKKIRKAIEKQFDASDKETLHLVGSALDGVGLGDCVKSAVNAVSKFSRRCVPQN